MFRRKPQQPPAKPHFGTPVAERRPLTAADVEALYVAAEEREDNQVPSIYDLEALCQSLLDRYPVEVRQTLKQLRWLMCTADKCQAGWSHPWDGMGKVRA